ncbi:prolyl oligopeptidase family serine peptidase [Spongiactinospora sp. TRM90649]|uniref:prolyl oligopeptidase family serine peptidase n=1 Tax=Spongiactinospora sp. TRM90649 TaxID=3031114 RepID=UPI0023F622FB|nr:prolyl oligopeptidase family serine peptidase [Spongiactinospora sp. TRM90649]MDF5752286.1 prolyl oligopeptidase family serine peptidase [Spongiactinospora sp. TRM90649]
MRYPAAQRLPIVDYPHGHRVADPYRWLEDPGDPATGAWLEEQDALCREQAARLSARERFRTRLAELGAIGSITAPEWRGPHAFTVRREPGQEHPALCRDGDVLLDPTLLDPTGLTTLDAWQPDLEGRLLAYQVSQRGDERAVMHVMDVATGAVVDGPIGGCRYSPVSWLPGGERFYYVRFHQGVYLHTVGTPSELDECVLTAGEGFSYGLGISPDGRWLIVSAAPGPSMPNDLWLADLSAAGPPDFRVIQASDAGARGAAAVGRDGRLYVITDRDAPRGRLLVGDPAEPGDLTVLLPEDPQAVLGSFTIVDGPERPLLLAVWIRHAIGEIGVHDAAGGRRVGTVETPGSGTIGSLTARADGGHEAWFTYTDAVTPAAVWRYDAHAGTAERWAEPPGAVPLPEVERRQVSFQSADGTRIRMIVIARPASGRRPRPAILTGYGGFGVPLTPGYAADSLAWVEAGGVLAVAHVRGGGEEGEGWHRDGMRDRKQNCFDDFAAAAEKLIADGWTTPAELGIWGESNGGLLVGAALTQRPELFGAAVCAAPLLDMVRYERSGLGPAWRGEYGSAADPDELPWLLAYSPYHRVSRGTDYPATLFTVSAADSRVDPMHARKMCAALQWATAGRRPIVLRHEPDVGHGARAVSRSVALAADALAFLAAHTGLVPGGSGPDPTPDPVRSDPAGLAGDADGVDAAAGAELRPRL